MSSEKTLRLLNEMRDSGELRTLVEGEIVVFEQKQEDNEEKLFQEMEALEQRTQCLKDSINQLDRNSVTHAKHVLHLILPWPPLAYRKIRVMPRYIKNVETSTEAYAKITN